MAFLLSPAGRWRLSRRFRPAAATRRDGRLPRHAPAQRAGHPAPREPPVGDGRPRMGCPRTPGMPPPERHRVTRTVVPEIGVEVGRHVFPRARLRFTWLARATRLRLHRYEQRSLGDHVEVRYTRTGNRGERVRISPSHSMMSARFAHVRSFHLYRIEFTKHVSDFLLYFLHYDRNSGKILYGEGLYRQCRGGRA